MSTAEAEYIALAEVTKEVTWLRQGLEEIGFPRKQPTTICQDNTAAISWARDPISSKRSKHIALRYHFVKEKVQSDEIVLAQVPTQNMHADILTKPIPKQAFINARENLGMASGRLLLQNVQ